MVILLHVFFGYNTLPETLHFLPRPIFQAISHGWLGVDLFFLISGFLITRILLKSKERPHYFRTFYFHRLLRIMPLYFVTMAVWVLLYRGFYSYFLLCAVFGANLASLLVITVPNGAGILWSLAIEEQFYLVWPLIVLLPRSKIYMARWLPANDIPSTSRCGAATAFKGLS